MQIDSRESQRLRENDADLEVEISLFQARENVG